MGVRLYKRLPLKIKKLENFNQFRKEVKSMLLNNSFYTLKSSYRANYCRYTIGSYLYLYINYFALYIIFFSIVLEWHCAV